MPSLKPIGHKSVIAHSLLCYCIEHQEYQDLAMFYNCWVNDVAIKSGFKIDDLEMKKFILEQIEADLNTPLEHLKACRDIEESFHINKVN